MPNPNPKLSNLKHFKKGFDPNRNLKGAPKLPDLDIEMAKVIGGKGDDNGLKQILMALYRKALKGDTRASEILLNRGYGMPKQTVQNDVTLNSVSNTGFKLVTKKD